MRTPHALGRIATLTSACEGLARLIRITAARVAARAAALLHSLLSQISATSNPDIQGTGMFLSTDFPSVKTLGYFQETQALNRYRRAAPSTGRLDNMGLEQASGRRRYLFSAFVS